MNTEDCVSYLHRGPLRSVFNLLFQNQYMKKFIGWKRNKDDVKWTKKAMNSLLKKVQKNKTVYDELLRALNNPEQPSGCVPIEATEDGRMQISNWKGYPHIACCRIWRWPDVTSYHELKSVDNCQFQFSVSSKMNFTCMNPFHYERVGNHTSISENSESSQRQKQSHCLSASSKLPYQNEAYNTSNYNVPATSAIVPPSNIRMESTNSLVNSDAKSLLPKYHQDRDRVMQLYPPPMLELYQVQYQESEYWGRIMYYEFDSQVGETFYCSTPDVTIDGFTNPYGHENRFCLGEFNNVNRNSVIKNTRRRIRKGIQITYTNGELFVECLSDFPVFVQSCLVNRLNRLDESTVLKVIPNNKLKIFSNQCFARILCQDAYRNLQTVHQLANMCTIRLAFVKGWGGKYHKPRVTSTPCSIEIHMNGALTWLNEIEITMQPPVDNISSMS